MNAEARVERRADLLDRLQELAQALQGEEFALERHQDRIGRRHGVDRQQVERGRAIDQHIGEALLARGQCPRAAA